MSQENNYFQMFTESFKPFADMSAFTKMNASPIDFSSMMNGMRHNVEAMTEMYQVMMKFAQEASRLSVEQMQQAMSETTKAMKNCPANNPTAAYEQAMQIMKKIADSANSGTSDLINMSAKSSNELLNIVNNKIVNNMMDNNHTSSKKKAA